MKASDFPQRRFPYKIGDLVKTNGFFYGLLSENTHYVSEVVGRIDGITKVYGGDNCSVTSIEIELNLNIVTKKQPRRYELPSPVIHVIFGVQGSSMCFITKVREVSRAKWLQTFRSGTYAKLLNW